MSVRRVALHNIDVQIYNKKVADKTEGIENETPPQRQVDSEFVSRFIEELNQLLAAEAEKEDPQVKRPWHIIGGYNFCYKGAVPSSSIFAHFDATPNITEFPTFTLVAWQGFPGEEVESS